MISKVLGYSVSNGNNVFLNNTNYSNNKYSIKQTDMDVISFSGAAQKGFLQKLKLRNAERKFDKLKSTAQSLNIKLEPEETYESLRIKVRDKLNPPLSTEEVRMLQERLSSLGNGMGMGIGMF